MNARSVGSNLMILDYWVVILQNSIQVNHPLIIIKEMSDLEGR